MTEPVKETKAQKVERLKRALNPWEARAEIERFAREGHGAIPPGVGDVLPVVGRLHPGRRRRRGRRQGRRGQGRPLLHGAHPHPQRHPSLPPAPHHRRPRRASRPRASPTSPSARTSSSTGSRSRTCPRCSSASRSAGSPAWARAATSRATSPAARWPAWTPTRSRCLAAGPGGDRPCSTATPTSTTCPRKYKISITGCRVWCSYPEINDVGLTAVPHPDTGEVGFSLRVGGGLSTDAAPRGPARRLRPLEPGGPGRPGRLRDLPRQRGPAPEPREGAAQVPLPEPRLDRRALPGRARAAPRLRAGPGRAGGAARRRLPRPRRDPPAEAGRLLLCRPGGPAGPDSRRRSCARPPSWPTGTGPASCAPPTCRTC